MTYLIPKNILYSVVLGSKALFCPRKVFTTNPSAQKKNNFKARFSYFVQENQFYAGYSAIISNQYKLQLAISSNSVISKNIVKEEKLTA